jgi:hypothetical protein
LHVPMHISMSLSSPPRTCAFLQWCFVNLPRVVAILGKGPLQKGTWRKGPNLNYAPHPTLLSRPTNIHQTFPPLAPAPRTLIDVISGNLKKNSHFIIFILLPSVAGGGSLQKLDTATFIPPHRCLIPANSSFHACLITESAWGYRGTLIKCHRK